MKILRSLVWFILILAPVILFAEDKLEETKITLDLKEPCYEDGVISTEKGGVIQGPKVRIQAKKIRYVRKKGDNPLFYVEAEGDLMVQFGLYAFVGSRLEFDFITNSGTIYNARSNVEPWFFGGEVIQLCSDGNYRIQNAYFTTSEHECPEWKMVAEEACLLDNHLLKAHRLYIEFGKVPLLWVPRFSMDLDAVFDSPIQYDIRWGGRRSRFGLIYEFFSWNRFKAFVRADYHFKYGIGGGLETYYTSLDRKHYLETINYLAQDKPQSTDPEYFGRYRFQGVYHGLVDQDRIDVHLTWDKVSDKEMASDYGNNGLELDTAGRTQLSIRRQEDNWWITNFFTRVRVNNFQSIKQELPSLETTFKPFVIGSTGIVMENLFRASYLDYVYSKQLLHELHHESYREIEEYSPYLYGRAYLHARNYQSSRFEFNHKIYRPFHLGIFNFTPEAGAELIYYGNTPHKHHSTLLAGHSGFELNTYLNRSFCDTKHVVKPYVKYDYLTFPTSSPNEHYIFDIDDGWYRLNMFRFGIEQNFLVKKQGLIERYLKLDLWSNAFLDTKTLPVTVPKVYAKVTWNMLPTLRYSIDSAYDFQFQQIDHINFRTEWTLSANTAISIEQRHRSRYSWRKVQKNNFILESYRSIPSLLASPLSDRRNTFLVHAFHRFHPNWALEFKMRAGWGRRNVFPDGELERQKYYNEFEIDLLGTLCRALNVRISFQHRMNNDFRYSCAFSVGLSRPTRKSPIIPQLDF